MKSISLPVAIAAGSLFGFISFGAYASDGTITIVGSISDTTCSINGTATGTAANKTITLAPVSSGALSAAAAIAGTSADLTFVLSGCSAVATKAIAHFENDSKVDQASGNLINSGSATHVQVRLLNAQMQPVNITTNANNLVATNATTVSGGAATLQYYAQYYATGKASPGTVNASVQYTMQYQ